MLNHYVNEHKLGILSDTEYFHKCVDIIEKTWSL